MKPTAIVIHHSATPDGSTVSWDAIRTFHTSYRYRGSIISKQDAERMIADTIPGVEKPWRDIGYHYGIERVGDHYEVLLGRMLNEDGAHCPQGEMNRCGLGICLVGNFDIGPPPPAQWDLAVRLVRSLKDNLKIPTDRIYGHRDWAPKTCPGKLFDMDKFREAVR